MEQVKFLLEHGGITAYIIFILGGLLIGVAAERIHFLYFKYSINVVGSLAKLREFILKRDYTAALQVCNATPDSPELIVAKQGLLAAEHGREAMKSALGGAIHEVSKNCDKRIGFIALVAGVSTLLGLLGTISGLIKTFEALAVADASQKGTLLSNGVSEAMYATAAGLILGIAAMAVHSLATNKSEQIIGGARDLSYKLVAWVEQSERGSSNG